MKTFFGDRTFRPGKHVGNWVMTFLVPKLLTFCWWRRNNTFVGEGAIILSAHYATVRSGALSVLEGHAENYTKIANFGQQVDQASCKVPLRKKL